MKKKILEYLAQALMIVFSVVLGLYLSEKIADYNQHKEGDILLSHIKYEISENADLLNDWHPYHREIYKTFDSLYLSNNYLDEFIKDKNTLFSYSLSRGTFMSEFPSSAAWEIAKSNPNISKVSHENMLLLSRLYKQQNLTFTPLTEDLIKLFHSSDVNSPKKAKSNLGTLNGHMQELVGREKSLLQYYKEAYKVLNIEDQKE